MKIVIVGSGYVGLVTGACLAHLGHEVVCVDNDPAKVAMLQAGGVPIFEPGLAELMAGASGEGRLRFAGELASSLKGAAAAFICVGTPPRPEDGHADLSYVMSAAAEIIAKSEPGMAIVTKSTVPIGTGDEIEAMVGRARPGAGLKVISNPEFLREGVAIADFLQPDRIVAGCEDEASARLMSEIYEPLTRTGAPLLTIGRRTAEVIKYAANSFLAVKITYINEIAKLCEEVGADIQDVSNGIGLDSRIGTKFLQPGPGFGGSCFPKDMLALIKTAQDHGVPLRSVETAIAVNDARKGEMVRKIVEAAGGSVAGKRIAVLGLTFKAETDDMRSAVSLVILPRLKALGADVRAYDPAGMKAAEPLLPGVKMMASLEAAVDGAELAVILTEWREFREMDLGVLADRLATPLLVDLRNLFRPADCVKAGLTYVSIGRRTARGRKAKLAAA